MRNFVTRSAMIAGIAAAIALTGSLANAQSKPPFGTPEDAAYAKDIWTALTAANLVGANAINVRPFEGNEPHGSIQQVLDSKIKVRGRTARVIVKRNYGGKGVTVQSVYDNPSKNLGAVTVMFKREKGYDPEDLDWMWVKFKGDGSLHKNPKGMLLAGRVAKGADVGCIACHKAAGGADMETLTAK